MAWNSADAVGWSISDQNRKYGSPMLPSELKSPKSKLQKLVSKCVCGLLGS